MTAPAFAPTDELTGSLLDLINADFRPFAESDRNTIAATIRDAADATGFVSPNAVRRALASLPVRQQPKPQRIGPVYRALVSSGVLVVADGYELSDDVAGGNSGKPHRTYRWVG